MSLNVSKGKPAPRGANSKTVLTPSMSQVMPKPSVGLAVPRISVTRAVPRTAAGRIPSKPPADQTVRRAPASQAVPSPSAGQATPRPSPIQTTPKPSVAQPTPRPLAKPAPAKLPVGQAIPKPSPARPTPKPSVSQAARKPSVARPVRNAPVSEGNRAPSVCQRKSGKLRLIGSVLGTAFIAIIASKFVGGGADGSASPAVEKSAPAELIIPSAGGSQNMHGLLSGGLPGADAQVIRSIKDIRKLLARPQEDRDHYFTSADDSTVDGSAASGVVPPAQAVENPLKAR